jgi:hypothetical protein
MITINLLLFLFQKLLNWRILPNKNLRLRRVPARVRLRLRSILRQQRRRVAADPVDSLGGVCYGKRRN